MDEPTQLPTDRSNARTRAQWTLVGVIVALSVGAAAYRLLKWQRLDETAALFVGLPAILAIALALTPRAKSATGMVMEGLTIALLLSGPLLVEGFVCVLMAAPLFYAVGAGVGWAMKQRRAKARAPPPRTAEAARFARRSSPLLFALSLEGVHPALELPRDVSVTAVKRVAAAPAAVEARLAAPPVSPRRCRCSCGSASPPERRRGRRPGGRRHPHPPLRPRRRAQEARLRRRRARARLRPLPRPRRRHQDRPWLTWRDAEVRWARARRCHRRRGVSLHSAPPSPGWYFGPLESYGASAAADYLIDSLATP